LQFLFAKVMTEAKRQKKVESDEEEKDELKDV